MTARFVVATVEPYYRVLDTRTGAVVGARRSLVGALRLAARLNR